MAQQFLPMTMAPELMRISKMIDDGQFMAAERLLKAASRRIKQGATPPFGWDRMRPLLQAKINGWHRRNQVEREKREARKLCGAKTPAGKKAAKKRRKKQGDDPPKKKKASKKKASKKKTSKKAVAKKKATKK